MADSMRGFRPVTLTQEGHRLITMAQAGRELRPSSIKIGDGYLPPTADLSQVTGMVRFIRSYGIVATDISRGNVAVFRTIIGTEGASQPFEFREIGIYFIDPDTGAESPKPFAYTNAGDDAEFVPADGGAFGKGITLDLPVAVSGSANIFMQFGPPTDYVTFPDLAAYTLQTQFQPTVKYERQFGEHYHEMDRVWGLADALDEWERRFELLRSEVNNGITGGTEFRITFWDLGGIQVTDGIWDAANGRMRA